MVYMAILSKVAGPLENIVMHQSVYFIIQFKKKKNIPQPQTKTLYELYWYLSN